MRLPVVVVAARLSRVCPRSLTLNTCVPCARVTAPHVSARARARAHTTPHTDLNLLNYCSVVDIECIFVDSTNIHNPKTTSTVYIYIYMHTYIHQIIYI